MRFSEYLINLNEGNLGHTLEKGFDASSKGKEESSDIEVKPLKEWNAPTIDESYRPGEAYNYGRDEEDEEGEAPVTRKKKNTLSPAQIRAREAAELAAAKVKQKNAEAKEREVEKKVEKEEGEGVDVEGRAVRAALQASRRGSSKSRRKGKPRSEGGSGRRSEDLQNDSLEIPMRDALGRLSIYSINEGVAHMKRQLKSKNITAAEKRKIQQKLHDKETRDRPRQLARAGDSKTPLDIAVNAADRASEPVTPAPKKQRVSTPAETADHKENAPKWVKKMSEEERLARAANDAAEGERRGNAEGMDRQSHLDK